MSLFVLVFGVLLGLQAWSESLSSPSARWNSALQKVLNQNAEVIEAEHDYKSQQARLFVSYGSWSPTLGVQGDSTRLDSGVTSHSVSLVATQNIFKGFNTWAETQLAQINLEKARLNLENKKTSITVALLEMLARHYFLNKEKVYLEKLVKLQSDVQSFTNRRVSIGAEPDISSQSAEAQLLSAQTQVLEKNLQLNEQLFQTQELFGFEEVDLWPIVVDRDFVEKLHKKISEFVLSQGKDLQSLSQKSLALNLESLKQSRTSELSAYWPTLNASGGLSYSSLTQQTENYVALELKIPLFQGLKHYYTRSSWGWNIQKQENTLRAQVQRDKLSEKLLFKQLVLEIEILAKMELSNLALQKAQLKADKMYRLGTLSYSSYIDIQRRATESELLYQRKLFSVMQQELKIVTDWGFSSDFIAKEIEKLLT